MIEGNISVRHGYVVSDQPVHDYQQPTVDGFYMVTSPCVADGVAEVIAKALTEYQRPLFHSFEETQEFIREGRISDGAWVHVPTSTDPESNFGYYFCNWKEAKTRQDIEIRLLTPRGCSFLLGAKQPPLLPRKIKAGDLVVLKNAPSGIGLVLTADAKRDTVHVGVGVSTSSVYPREELRLATDEEIKAFRTILNAINYPTRLNDEI